MYICFYGVVMLLSNERVVKHRIIQPGVWRLSMACCSLCVRFCTYIVIARTLGTQNFGILLFIQWIATLFLPVIGIGMTPVTSRTIVDIQHYETSRSIAGIFHLLWRQQCRRILLYCLAYIPLAFLLALFTKGAIPLFLLLIAGLAALPLLLSSIVSTTLQGLRRYDLLAGLRFFSTLLNFCLALVEIHVHEAKLGVLLLTPAFVSIATLTIALLYVTKFLPLHEVTEPGPLLRERIERSQRPSWLLFLLDSVIWREFLFLVLILLYWHMPSVLGFYAFSMLLCIHLIEVAPTVFVTCVVPLLSRLFPVQHYSNTYNAFVRTSCMIAIIAVVLCTLLTLCSPLLIEACFGVAYLPMIGPLRVLLIAVVFGSIATVSLTYLAQHTPKREQLWLSIGTAVLHVGLGVPCIVLWGITGAAIAGTVAHVFASTSTILLCRNTLLRYA